jgi:hypothetical protein
MYYLKKNGHPLDKRVIRTLFIISFMLKKGRKIKVWQRHWELETNRETELQKYRDTRIQRYRDIER